MFTDVLGANYREEIKKENDAPSLYPAFEEAWNSIEGELQKNVA